VQAKKAGQRAGLLHVSLKHARPADARCARKMESAFPCSYATTERLHTRVGGGRLYAVVAAHVSEAFLRSRPRFRNPSRLRGRWSQQRPRGLAWRSGVWATLTTPEVAVWG
jgi:hypothetical protein